MITINEDYVSFETAKLLKEKGFPQDPYTCNTVYTPKGKLSNNAKSFWNPFAFTLLGREYYMAPTQALAIRWLREEYNLFIEIQCYGCEADEKAHFEFSYVISEYVQIDNKICTTVGLEEKKAKSQFKSYEQACEAAIKYCLENLI